VMGAARPAEIIAYAEGRTERARDVILDRFDWSVERYESEMETYFDYVDPANQAGRVEPERVLLFDAERDGRMPQTARDALWEVMGRPDGASRTPRATCACPLLRARSPGTSRPTGSRSRWFPAWRFLLCLHVS